MQIKYLTKNYTIELSDLESNTVGGLRKKVKETIKECADLANEKVLLFHNKTKVSASEETKLEEVKITNDSTVFIVLIKTEQPVQNTPPVNTKTQVPNNFNTPLPGFNNSFSNQAPATPNMYNNMQQNGMPAMDPSVIEQQLFDQMLKDPDAMLSMVEQQMPGMSEEQKLMLKQNIELMKKNPEMIKQMLSNPTVMNNIRNTNMGGNPMMGGVPPYMNNNNPMMNNPMASPYIGNNPMASPYMGNPYMNNNPMMNNPMMNNNAMMNNGYYNPYMMQQQQMNNQAPPPNGPCSHGFYPPKMVNGMPEGQDLEVIFSDKLTALSEMGFNDKNLNLKALNEARGDISEAIDILSKNLNK